MDQGERNMENSSSLNEFDELAELIAEKWYGGKLPPYPAAIVQILLGTIPDTELPAVPAEVREEAKKRFADCLSLALADRIRAQSVDAETRLPN